MSNLSIANVISISVATPQPGLGAYNTSNLAIFTEEPYESSSFGSDGYKLYLSPTEVGEDFGTDSKTYAMATSVFSQNPNILANRGYLVVIPMTVEVQTVSFDATPTSGVFRLNFAGDVTADINWDDTAAEVQALVRTLTGLEDAVVEGAIDDSTGLTITFNGYYGDAALMTVSDNTLDASGAVAVTVAEETAGETIAEAITRTTGLIEYFGMMGTYNFVEADILAAAAVVQALNKILFVVGVDSADVETGGKLDLLRSGAFTHTRGLYYGDGASDLDTALAFMASYAGMGLSTVFEGSNTTQTMHLKTLATVQPDSTMNQTLLNKCQAAGADVYISIQGVSKTFCSGLNEFFDNIYNLLWFVGALEVAGFNALAQTNTKIPQTEGGMDILKGAYRQVCQTAVANQFSSPGTWNNPTTFGNQENFYQNISQRGYYIYSPPISQQSPASREARQAPLVQIALKYAGAIHSGTVVVNVNP